MSTRTDWLEILFLTGFWTTGLLVWGYIRRRRLHISTLRTIPLNKRIGVYILTLLSGFAFGLLVKFGLRVFHGELLIMLAADLGVAVIVIFGFRLLHSPNIS